MIQIGHFSGFKLFMIKSGKPVVLGSWHRADMEIFFSSLLNEEGWTRLVVMLYGSVKASVMSGWIKLNSSYRSGQGQVKYKVDSDSTPVGLDCGSSG